MSRDSENVVVQGLYLQVNRPRSYGVSFAPNDPVELWLPKSLVLDGKELETNRIAGLKQPASVEIPMWFAIKEDLSF